jgi:hypothetical protein
VNVVILTHELIPPRPDKSLRAFLRLRRLDTKSKVLLWLLLPLVIAFSAAAQEAEQDYGGDTGKLERAVESPINYADIRYKPNNRSDPFLNPLLLSKNSNKDDEEVSKGLPPPGIAGTYIAQLAFEGTSFRDDRPLAIVRGADNRAYFLKEGDRLFDGYLKTIQTDSIILVRETKLRSGKILTQDVTKRLRKP